MDNIKIEVDKLKETGLIFQNPIFLNDFNEYLKDLNLNIEFFIFNSSESSKVGKRIDGQFIKVPLLKIYLKSTSNLVNENINLLDSNWNGDYVHTLKIIQKWNNLIEFYDYPKEYKNLEMIVLIHSFEDLVLNLLIRTSKKDVMEMIKKDFPKCLPEYLFCNSKLVYNIVFKNKKDFEIFNTQFKPTFIVKLNEILRKNDTLGYYTEDKIKINYFHKDMKELNLYGLSRED